MLDSLKDTANISGRNYFSGDYSKQYKGGMLDDEFASRSRERTTKSLSDYARDSESEREEEDVYAHYMQQMEKAKKERAAEVAGLSSK